ncbi:radical SAM protein [Candidatus Omnitrophota bacterium]
MSYFTYLSIAKSLTKAKFFGKNAPLAVSWAVTYRCNLRCKYCSLWSQPSKELSTEQIFTILDEIGKTDVQWISFTGGEPLLRNDIGDIINYAKSKGIFVNLNTNAILIAEKLDAIENADSVQISLDAEQNINDLARGKGAYQAAHNALSLLRNKNVRIKIQTVLSKHNLDNLDFIFEFLKKFQLPIIFQPATTKLLGSEQANPSVPEAGKYFRAVNKTIRKKQEGYYISNSLSGLRHLRCYPNDKKIACLAGLINCDIKPDGTMLACARYPASQKKIDLLQVGFIKGFNALEAVSCKQCWCASQVELNLISSFNLRAVLNFVNNNYSK